MTDTIRFSSRSGYEIKIYEDFPSLFKIMK